jgi:hypothetical protein
MDWVTLTRQQVENDALPRVCMACGKPATCSLNETFSYSPDWVGWLYYAGYFPGVIAEHFFRKEMRVSCRYCHEHRNQWQILYWIAGIGWLLAGLLAAGIGYLVAIGIGSTSTDIGLGIGAGVGLLAWLIVVIYLYNTRVSFTATRITAADITFEGVADAFVKAVKDQQIQSSLR